MGLIISIFRKKKEKQTTYQILEVLEDKIQKIEAYSLDTQRRQKRIVGNIIVVLVGLNIAAFLIYYFLFLPSVWSDRILRASPIILFPIFIILLRNIVRWYFQRKVNNNVKTLNKMKEEKKVLLEKVMETETYKVAVEILNRFGKKMVIAQMPSPTPTTPDMRQPSSRTPWNTPVSSVNRQQWPNNNNLSVNPRSLPITATTKPLVQVNSSDNKMVVHSGFQGVQRLRTPFPVIDFESKGVLEKMVDYLIGDGPSHRFAMICRKCNKHNGMALEDEYYFIAFQCVHCNEINPAKKIRPTAPSLINSSMITQRTGRPATENSNSSSSEDASDSEDDAESEKNEMHPKISETKSEEISNEAIVADENVMNTNQEIANVLNDDNSSQNEEVDFVKTDSDKKTD